MPKMQSILGTEVTLLAKEEVLKLITKACDEKNKISPLFLVTAYSETFLEARSNKDFRAALERATYILPDGVSVLEAADFLEHASKNIFANILVGISIGAKTLQGKYAHRVTGVELARTLLEEKKDKKILLLGGWGGVSERLAKKYDVAFIDAPEKIEGFDQHEDLVNRINKMHCDILLISFGRFKQEIWIAQQLENLQCKVVIGVGSSFDELAGEGIWSKKIPGWVEKVGLKWLWRAFHDKSHIKRAWNAFPVFPWKVFMSSLKGAGSNQEIAL